MKVEQAFKGDIMDKHLFLFGGSPSFTLNMAKRFVIKALKTNAPVSNLFVEREGWEQYIPRYTKSLEDLGLNEFYPFLQPPLKKLSTV